MRYQILFFGDEEPRKITREQFVSVKAYLKNNPPSKFIEVDGNLLNIASIKGITQEGQEIFPELPEASGTPPSKELMEKIRMEHIK